MAILRVKPALQKPVVGGSINEWGDILNSNIDVQDNFNNSILIDSEAKDSEIERLDREKVSRTDVDTVVQTSVDEYINTNGNVKLDEHVESVNKPELDRYTEEKKKDIGNVINDLGSYNINTKSNYKTWIGSESDYQSLSVKENGVLYMTFDSLFNVVTKYFKPKLDIVKNGLVCWLDGRDGVNENTTWKDRSGNGNDATLSNFNWTKESGFTGKSLVLDGVDDKFTLKNSKLTNYTLFIKGRINDSSVRNRIIGKEFVSGKNQIILTDNKILNLIEPNITSHSTGIQTPADFELVVTVSNSTSVKVVINSVENVFSFTANKDFNTWVNMYNDETSTKMNIDSIKLYNRVLSDEEIKRNLEYEQSIDRVVPETLDEKIYDKDYCIGNTSDLTEEQKKIFRLSNDKTKFVSGVNNVSGIAVETYTYEEIQKIMETPEWRSEEENTISDDMVKNINGEWR